MDREAIIIVAPDTVEEGARQVKEHGIVRISAQLQRLPIARIHRLELATGESLQEGLRRIGVSTREGIQVLLLESNVATDMAILEQCATVSSDDPLIVTRPLESAFSTIGMPMNPASHLPFAATEPHAARQLPMGVYLLPDKEFRKMIEAIGDVGADTMAAIEAYMLRQRARYLSIEARNTEIEKRPPSGPAVREQVPRMLEIGESIVTKRATNGREKLRAEVQWLRQLPEQARPLFSEVIDAHLDGDTVSYAMPRYPMKNLEELVQGGEIAPGNMEEILVSMYAALAEKLYCTQSSNPVPGYIRFRYIEKIKQRTAAAAELSPLFAQYTSALSLNVNGSDMPGLPAFLRGMEEDIPFLASMEPPRMTTVHGDLKPDNMLVAKDGVEFHFIDPMGLGLEDTALDGAKPLSTFQAYHHAFKNGRMRIDLSEKEGLKVQAVFAGDGELDQQIAGACDRAIQRIARLPFFAEDNRWLSRAKLHSALIQLAFASYHLIATEGREDQVAVGLLARGLEMMEDVYPRERLTKERGRFGNYRYAADRELIRGMLSEQ